MTATACTLAALLTFETASAPAAKDACERTDDRCKAALYERRSMTAANANHRAQYLHNAHNLYLRLFDKTGDARDLCAARRAIEASLAVEDQPATLRSESRGLRTQLLARAKQQGARCGGEAKRRVTSADAPLVARASTPASAAGPTPAERDSASSTTPAHSPTRRLPLLADSDSASADQPTEVALMPVRPRNVQTPPAPSTSPGRGLLLAGGLTLGVGAALTAAAGVMGHRAVEARREANALHDTYDTYPPPDVATRGDALVHDFNVMKSQTVALALTGGATIVVAAVLATLGGRRMARAARRTALVPGPGGLVFRGRV